MNGILHASAAQQHKCYWYMHAQVGQLSVLAYLQFILHTQVKLQQLVLPYVIIIVQCSYRLLRLRIFIHCIVKWSADYASALRKITKKSGLCLA